MRDSVGISPPSELARVLDSGGRVQPLIILLQRFLDSTQLEFRKPDQKRRGSQTHAHEFRKFGRFLLSEERLEVWEFVLSLEATSRRETQRETGLDDSTINRAVNDLESWGIIERRTLPNPRGSGRGFELISLKGAKPEKTAEATQRLLHIIREDTQPQTYGLEEYTGAHRIEDFEKWLLNKGLDMHEARRRASLMIKEGWRL